ncbi:protease pro-enzyme activation domain-containing protein [Gloeobacter kilaueensis]|uniref:Peptidase S53 propeptide n=1 Tax=Gloeobacter kilaueensis (strain ATCC BAA-2537 / CCAP 1431/1 / ULC 316 / JS1) TaxID=1183438 RepID=U5QNQ5_GLOK1|nr:protease pro-enzyme activation domain-containing protein [Gloeobacter kilaueensis]AGY60561.1 peptidase S53 propeptide [Gloeobacter kilaueensis JS1]
MSTELYHHPKRSVVYNAERLCAILCLGLALVLPTAAWSQENRIQIRSGFEPFSDKVQVRGAASPSDELTLDIFVKVRDYDGYVKYFKQMELGNRLPEKEEQKLLQSFEPSLEDYDTLIGWIREQGLSIVFMDREGNRKIVRAKGRIDDLESAFKVKFAEVQVDGKHYNAAQSPPTLPSSIARIVMVVNGFQPYRQLIQNVRNVVVKAAPLKAK